MNVKELFLPLQISPRLHPAGDHGEDGDLRVDTRLVPKSPIVPRVWRGERRQAQEVLFEVLVHIVLCRRCRRKSFDPAPHKQVKL